MAFNTTYKNGNIEIQIIGDLDLEQLKQIKEELYKLANDNDCNLIIDFSKVDYMDSSGVAVLIKLYKILNEKNKQIELINYNERIEKILSLSSLDELIKY